MANNLIISYDLNRPGQSYPEVEKRIKELGAAKKLLETVWFVSSKYSATQARNHIQKSSDSNDSIAVFDAKNNDYAVSLDKTGVDFLSKNWN